MEQLRAERVLMRASKKKIPRKGWPTLTGKTYHDVKKKGTITYG